MTLSDADADADDAPSGKRPPSSLPPALTLRVERVSGSPVCSMKKQDLCLCPAGQDNGSVVRVTMTGKKANGVYCLCHACAAAGGHLDNLRAGWRPPP